MACDELSPCRQILNLLNINASVILYWRHQQKQNKRHVVYCSYGEKYKGKEIKEGTKILISNTVNVSGLRLAELIHRGRERDEMEELGETYRAPTFDPGDVDE